MSSSKLPTRVGIYTPLDPSLVGGMRTWLSTFWTRYSETRDLHVRIVHAGLRPKGATFADLPAHPRIELTRVPAGIKMPTTGASLPLAASLASEFAGLDILYFDNGYFLQDRMVLRTAAALSLPVVSGHHAVVRGDGVHRIAWEISGRPAIKHFSAVHALSECDASYLRSIGARNVHVVPIAVDMDPRAVTINKIPVLGFLGRLHEQKGVDLLLSIVREVKRDRKNGVIIRVGGDGPLRGDVEVLASEGLVEYVGSVPRSDVREFLKGLDVLIMPSRRETFGIVAVEAQACGTPVVAADIDALREVICPGISRTVPSRDPRAWTAVLDARLNDRPTEDDRRRLMSEIASRFGFDSVARRFDELLLAGTRAR